MQTDVYRVKRYKLEKFNRIETVKLPMNSNILGMMANNTNPDLGAVQLLVEVPVLADNVKEEFEEHRFLLLHGDAPYGNILTDEEELYYVGSGHWDNGYRLAHVFEIINIGCPFEDEVIEAPVEALEAEVIVVENTDKEEEK